MREAMTIGLSTLSRLPRPAALTRRLLAISTGFDITRFPATRESAESEGPAHAGVRQVAARIAVTSHGGARAGICGRLAGLTLAFAVAVFGSYLSTPDSAQAQSCSGVSGPCFQGMTFLPITGTDCQASSNSLSINEAGTYIAGYSTTTVPGGACSYEGLIWQLAAAPGGGLLASGFLNPSCLTD